MSYFVCLVRPSGAPVTERDRQRAMGPAHRKGLRVQPWANEGSFAATAVGTSLRSSPSIASAGALCIVGTVRLDNRETLAPVPLQAHDTSDLAFMGATLRERGTQALADVIGDFAFACWNGKTRTLVAARDPLGVRHLFWASIEADLLAFASHASLLALGDACSHDYIAHALAGTDRTDLTIYDGVRHVPAGSSIRVADGRATVSRYWSVGDVPSGEARFRRDQCDEFRELFRSAVRLRLPDSGSVWAELSGGLDTSSVIMTAEHLRRCGETPVSIAGTVTYAESLAGGDESVFVDAVLAASGLSNQALSNHWPWQDDDDSPSEAETPSVATTFWARDRRRDRLLADAGADVLLSGAGGDYVLGGTEFYLADWIANGHVPAALRELVRLSAVAGESFWKRALANAVVPLLPTPFRSRFATVHDWVIPPCVNRTFRRRHDMSRLVRSQRAHGLKRRGGSKYREAFENRVNAMAFGTVFDSPSADYERRYPFLYRPLVEFALRLAPNDDGHRPLAGKWILRESMRGILPEPVRTRVGKGSVGSRMLWALEHERDTIESMLRDPILAQMGCVDAAPLRDLYTEARSGRIPFSVGLFTTLALETWLRIRSGRWPVRSAASRNAVHAVRSLTVNLQEVV